MLKKLITNVLENSDHEITGKEENNHNVLHIKLNNGILKVSVNPQHTFNINGVDKNQQKKLREYIEKEIRYPVREIALEKFYEGAVVWNKWRKEHGQLFIDFSELNISDTDLSKIELQNVDLSYSKFHNVNFEGSNFHNCKLIETKLIKCNLKRTDLSFIDGLMADFTKSDLSHTKLSSANLGASILKETKLHDTVLDETNLKNADLTKAELFNTNLSGGIINLETVFEKTKGIELGINGIWNAETDSAAYIHNHHLVIQ